MVGDLCFHFCPHGLRDLVPEVGFCGEAVDVLSFSGKC